MIKMRTLVTLCAALALTVGVATATAGGGNSGNAKLCQKGGWQYWVRVDQTPFKNQGDCVSYAARGGILTAPGSSAQSLCEDQLGGTYAGPQGSSIAWTCSWQHALEDPTETAPLGTQCQSGGGSGGYQAIGGAGLFTCNRS